MGTEDIEQLVDSALLKGILEAECLQCGTSLQCEPDATHTWCDNCNQIVRVRNELIKLGYI
jgi:predicted RNA-binding Zn-ribbon protein involved in translation (DUF1610 family)